LKFSDQVLISYRYPSIAVGATLFKKA